MSNISIFPIDRTLSGTTTPGQSGPGINFIERILHIPQISEAEASPSNGLISYPGHSLVMGSYPSVEMNSMYSTAPTNWAVEKGVWQFLTNAGLDSKPDDLFFFLNVTLWENDIRLVERLILWKCHTLVG